MRESASAPHLLAAEVAQVLLRTNGFALCVRAKAGPAGGRGPLAVVGGLLRAGEPLDAAARRVTEDVSGVRVGPAQQEFCGLAHRRVPGGSDLVTAVFVAQSWTGEPHNAEPDAHEGLYWVSMEEPPPDCHSHTAAVFRLLTQGPSYRALNWPVPKGVL
ncbi:NUDIX domain-containing protein [Streptomyces sp. NPDC004111]|uniref:NUDIX domain-containing protein n=1 Tax=Streptomyces sp. NPDC004111 TaxID=3364690 RepID=UPI00369C2007